MLVLSRHRDEAIMINDDVEIIVVDIRGDKVRLGVSAPANVAVHRKEIYEAIRQENANAAQLQSVLGLAPASADQQGAGTNAGTQSVSRTEMIRAIAAGRVGTGRAEDQRASA